MNDFTSGKFGSLGFLPPFHPPFSFFTLFLLKLFELLKEQNLAPLTIVVTSGQKVDLTKKCPLDFFSLVNRILSLKKITKNIKGPAKWHVG